VAKRTKITPYATTGTLSMCKPNFRSTALLKKIELNGKVFSSRGEGKKFLELPWVKRQIKQKLGFTPYPGTLNVRLSEESVKRKKLLEKAHSIKVFPAEGYCSGKLIKAFIGKLECAIVIPEVAGYPKEVLEVIAPVNLRETLQLKDGGEVTVTVTL
jgi:riboflavin kinase